MGLLGKKKKSKKDKSSADGPKAKTKTKTKGAEKAAKAEKKGKSGAEKPGRSAKKAPKKPKIESSAASDSEDDFLLQRAAAAKAKREAREKKSAAATKTGAKKAAKGGSESDVGADDAGVRVAAGSGAAAAAPPGKVAADKPKSKGKKTKTEAGTKGKAVTKAKTKAKAKGEGDAAKSGDLEGEKAPLRSKSEERAEKPPPSEEDPISAAASATDDDDLHEPSPAGVEAVAKRDGDSTGEAKNSPTGKCSWLRKQGDDLFGAWRTRWCVLDTAGSRITYSKSQSGSSQGHIDLTRIETVSAVDKDAFDITMKDGERTFHLTFAGLTEAEARENHDLGTIGLATAVGWVDAVVASLKKLDPAAEPRAPGSLGDEI